MNRLKQLIQDNTFGTINESDYPELIELLIKDRSERVAEANYFGEQLMTVKAENALLKINKNMGIS